MRIITILCVVCVLFTSCYSYKPYQGAAAQTPVDAKYHFDLESGKEFSTRIDSVGTDAYYITKYGKVETVPFSEVQLLEDRKFSTGRTLGLAGLIMVAAASIAAVIIFATNF